VSEAERKGLKIKSAQQDIMSTPRHARNDITGTLSFSLDGVATTISGDSVISRLSKSGDGVVQDVEAFYVVDPNGCAYLLVTEPYKAPWFDSNDIFTPGSTYSTSAEQVLGPLNEYNDLSNGFATTTEAPTLAPTTKAPTNQPTKQPTMLPTTAPTSAPTMHPTTEPTSGPTQYPTFQSLPPAPDSPVPLYAGPSRCGPEVALYGSEVFPDGRLLEGQDPKAVLELERERRELQTGESDLDLCYNGTDSDPLVAY
jgi:hypothetical protein